jgi:hypothetical protein
MRDIRHDNIALISALLCLRLCFPACLVFCNAQMLYPLTRPAPERRRKGGGCALEPFPTTFWLTCPLLKAKLSALEDAG